MNSPKGQAASEMGIAIALITVVGIVGLTLLGGVVQNGIGAHSASLQSADLAKLTAQNQAQSLASPQTAATSSLHPPSGDSLGIQLGNGQSLELNSYPEDLSQSIETAGANGTTTMLLATLDTVIEQTVKNGMLDETQASALSALSSQGHKIGDIGAYLESAIKTNKAPSDADHELSATIGFYDAAEPEGKEIMQMRALLAQAEAKGALNDPVLSQTINILSNQIINTANGIESSYVGIAIQKEMPASYFNQGVIDALRERDYILGVNTQQTLHDIGAAALIHDNASEICRQGMDTSACQS